MLYFQILRRGMYAGAGMAEAANKKTGRDLMSLCLYGLVGKKE